MQFDCFRSAANFWDRMVVTDSNTLCNVKKADLSLGNFAASSAGPGTTCNNDLFFRISIGISNLCIDFKNQLLYLSACSITERFPRIGVCIICMSCLNWSCCVHELTADLKHRMTGVWRDAELVDPNTHNNKLATYHSWFAIPFSRNERMPINVPRYLHLDLSKHVMRNISRFRLRAHTLKVEAAAWLEDGSCVCDQCPGEDEHESERGACS